LCESADAFHEELVGVLGEERKKPEALEWWVAIVRALTENTLLIGEL
jgi:hypothetical protein